MNAEDKLLLLGAEKARLEERLKLKVKFKLRQLIIINQLHDGNPCLVGDICAAIEAIEKKPCTAGVVFRAISSINSKSFIDGFIITRASKLGRGYKAVYKMVLLRTYE
jgi:hypothetical protein